LNTFAPTGQHVDRLFNGPTTAKLQGRVKMVPASAAGRVEFAVSAPTLSEIRRGPNPQDQAASTAGPQAALALTHIGSAGGKR